MKILLHLMMHLYFYKYFNMQYFYFQCTLTVRPPGSTRSHINRLVTLGPPERAGEVHEPRRTNAHRVQIKNLGNTDPDKVR